MSSFFSIFVALTLVQVMTDRFCVAAQQAAGQLKLLQGASNASSLEVGSKEMELVSCGIYWSYTGHILPLINGC